MWFCLKFEHRPCPCLAQVADIEAAEKDKMREKCQKILGHNINCFINRQLIYNFPEEIFADAGVMAIGERARAKSTAGWVGSGA